LLAPPFGATAAAAPAKAWPNKLIKLVIPFPAGGPPDVLARVVAQALSVRLGQTVIVENRQGAGTSIAAKAVATAPADGHTLLMAGQSLAYLHLLYPNLGFDPTRAFVPVATLVEWSHVMVVGRGVRVATVNELVAHAKANPGKLTFGFGLGTTPHILGEYFKAAAGVDITSVPYRGGEQARTDLIAGRIDINFGPPSFVVDMIEQKQVRALAITGPNRDPGLPDVPTMAESGYPQIGFDPDAWQAILVPAGTPADVVGKLNAAVNESLQSSDVKAALARLGFKAVITSPGQFAEFFAAEIRKWPAIIKAAHIQPE
jgi:tripartite-type tricarboxylate transporter receptor subunit TctC